MERKNLIIRRLFTILFTFVVIVFSSLSVLYVKNAPNVRRVPAIQEEKTIGKAIISREIEIYTTGDVTKVFPITLDTERILKGNLHPPEIMKLFLDKSVEVDTGEKLNIAYINKNYKHIPIKAAKKSKKKRKIKEIKDDRPVYAKVV